MSRVDQALKIVMGESAAPAAARATLSDYPEESAMGDRPAPPALLAEPRPAAPAPRPVLVDPFSKVEAPRRVPPGVQAVRPEGRGEFEGKLLANPSNSTVSLEQYRRLAAALLDAQAESGLKTVMVTSALPREGKTLTVVNLALTLSDSYSRRVLLIDADLRRPSVHSILGLRNENGLNEALHSTRNEAPPLVGLSPHLSVLPAGRPGQNPLAGLTSARMEGLLAECGTQYDWVLLDTPPVGLLPDARVLAGVVRAVLFVIGAGTTPSTVVERAIAELGPDWILGTVLNRVDEDAIPTVGYYGYDQGTNSPSR
jgi:capsular exopolysaccharide synthesis family protein